MTTRAPRRWRVTGRGWALLGSGGALIALWWMSHRVELLFAGAVAVAIPLCGLLLTLRRAGGEAPSRRLSRRYGSPFEELTLTIDHPHDGADWFDTFPDDWFVDRSGRTSTAMPVRRGVVSLGPIVRVQVDPFGCVGVRSEHTEPVEFVVWPEVIPDVRVPSARFHSEPGRRFRAGSGEDEVGVREYRSGDPLRQVHWKQTAHRDELMVRESNAEQRSRARLFVVFGSDRAQRAEEAIVLAASIADQALTAGVDVDLFVAGSPRAFSFSPAERSRMLSTLAVVVPSGGDAPSGTVRADDLVITSGDPWRISGSGATVVAVTGEGESAVVQHPQGGHRVLTGPDAETLASALGGVS
ncbi:MAG: DUF58 domain-containing protein [Mycetocola sp.]